MRPNSVSSAGPTRAGREGAGERTGYRLLPGSSRPGEGRGFQPAIVRAHARACVLSVTPGKFACPRPKSRRLGLGRGDQICLNRWHKASIFGPGPRQPLDREQRARFRFLCRAHRGANRLTANDVAVAEVLVSALGDDSQLDPSHATIAQRALVHIATVKRALARLQRLGLVSWVRRLVRGPDTGWRAEQTSNAYVLRVPSCKADFRPAVRLVQIQESLSAG